jgi:hypothetical protein
MAMTTKAITITTAIIITTTMAINNNNVTITIQQ